MEKSHHPDLTTIYRAYIDCLNAQDWSRLGEYVAEAAIHNGQSFGLAGYRRMLENDFSQIADLRFNIDVLVANSTHVASRLAFDCAPKREFLGLAVNGRRVRFAENVIYAFRDGKIVQVWSIVDKAAIEAQLSNQ